MSLRLRTIIAALALAAAPQLASATPFGPATASIAFTFSPSVVINANSGNSAAFNGGEVVFSATGSLAGTTRGTGTVNGTLTFGSTAGTVTAETLTNFLRLDDTTGGTFDFSVSSVQVNSFSSTPGVSTSIALYLLGTMGDANLGYSSTPTSLTVTLNQTGSSAYSSSATLSNPPSQSSVPEPASLVLLGAGLLAAGVYRTRAARRP